MLVLRIEQLVVADMGRPKEVLNEIIDPAALDPIDVPDFTGGNFCVICGRYLDNPGSLCWRRKCVETWRLRLNYIRLYVGLTGSVPIIED